MPAYPAQLYACVGTDAARSAIASIGRYCRQQAILKGKLVRRTMGRQGEGKEMGVIRRGGARNRKPPDQLPGVFARKGFR